MFDGIRVSAIAAVAENGVIGVNGDLPWHLPEDLRWFKRVTRKHAVIMGRKTWDSLRKPLPKRLNIVLSRSLELDIPGVAVARTVNEALALAEAWETAALEAGRIDEREIMIVGGGGIYAACWPWVDRFYRTEVSASPAGDARFPEVDLTSFVLTKTIAGDDGAALVYRFQILDRAVSGSGQA
ncbi:MAG: dihydrofolate reductase [Myxococcales bacterium]|nr:dihydrofolate reductase [Myxococcales bacterium]